MAVFRVERNKGYTVMSNHHLRNKELTLKAKGLLSQMLSLPDKSTGHRNSYFSQSRSSILNRKSPGHGEKAPLKCSCEFYHLRLRPARWSSNSQK